MKKRSRIPATAEMEYVTISMTVILDGLDSSVSILPFSVGIMPDMTPPNLAVYHRVLCFMHIFVYDHD